MNLFLCVLIAVVLNACLNCANDIALAPTFPIDLCHEVVAKQRGFSVQKRVSIIDFFNPILSRTLEMKVNGIQAKKITFK